MQTVTFKAPEEMLFKLEEISDKLERSRGYLIRKALEAYIAEQEEDAEDYRDAVKRLAKDNPKKRISLEQLEKKHGLED